MLDADGVPWPYDFQRLADLGILSQAALLSDKLKFITYNSNLTIKYIRFEEYTFVDSDVNSLFSTHYGAYKWATFSGCAFVLKELLYMTQEGFNLRLENSFIDITNLVQISVFQALTDCSIYLSENTGIANNAIWDNNIVTGLTNVGWGAMMHH